MGLAIAHLPGADRGMQKSEFWLGKTESYPSPGLSWSVCVMGVCRENYASCFLGGDSF